MEARVCKIFNFIAPHLQSVKIIRFMHLKRLDGEDLGYFVTRREEC